uniref:Catechol O-methyltransferase domain-containing protein 1 n=1 Tax=Ascaris suum TaxID=6253 RepID=F1L847_ASCSU
MVNAASNLTSSKGDKSTSTFGILYFDLFLLTLPMHPMSNVSKSHRSNDPIVKYCTSISVKQDPILQKLTENTLKNAPMGLGAPEVHQFGQNLIRLTHAKRALDIGTLTGASALAWALAVPADGEVISMDIDLEKLKRYGKEFIDSKPEISKKINFKLGPAVETLDSLIAAGESGKWDFAFIDADKTSYPYYYEKCVQLLRPGGVILIDNALRCGRVVLEDKDDETKAIDETNHIIANDTRVDNMLLNLGDGTHVVFKKYE